MQFIDLAAQQARLREDTRGVACLQYEHTPVLVSITGPRRRARRPTHRSSAYLPLDHRQWRRNRVPGRVHRPAHSQLKGNPCRLRLPSGEKPHSHLKVGAYPYRTGREQRRGASVRGEGGRISYSVYPSAILDEGSQIGFGSRAWHYVYVCGGACIGKGVSLGQNVFVDKKASIEDYRNIQSNFRVYGDITLEAGVFFGPSMVFTNVHNPHILVERKNEYRETLVRRGATLGANGTVVCGVTIGAFVAAGAVATRDVPEFALMVGTPARQIGWMSTYGEGLELPLSGKGETTCPHTGDRYTLNGESVIREETAT